MEKDGTGRGVKVTMAVDGCTSTVRAAAVNIGTRMRHKTHGMRGTRISVCTIALKTRSSSVKLRNHRSHQ